MSVYSSRIFVFENINYIMFCLYQKQMFIVILLFTVEEMNKWQYYDVTTLIIHLNNLNMNICLPRTQSTTKSLMKTKLS